MFFFFDVYVLALYYLSLRESMCLGWMCCELERVIGLDV
jgi:hypothetical protein